MSKIFLSVGATYTPEQEAFVTAFEAFLSQSSCERLTVGRGNYSAQQPIVFARELMIKADGLVVIAFTRTMVVKATEKPGSAKPTEHKNVRYPTIWNQLEAAMAFGLEKPLLLIMEEGLRQEAMLKDRLEYRALVTPLDVAFFKTDEFKGIFADWNRSALERSAKKVAAINPGELTVRQLLENLKPGELWKVLAALLAILTAVGGGALWLGKNLTVNPDPVGKPGIVQPAKTP